MNKNINQKERYLIVLGFIQSVIFISLILFIYACRTINLNGYKYFISEKAQLYKGVSGALHYLYGRTPLYRGKLNLGAWNSYQRVWIQKVVPITEGGVLINLDLELEHGNYFTLNFKKNRDAHYLGALISNNAMFASQFFKANHIGEVIFSKKINQDNLHSLLRKKRANIKLKLSTKGIDLLVDNNIVDHLDANIEGEYIFGFHGGSSENISVDNIKIYQDQNLIWSESFHPLVYLFKTKIYYFSFYFVLILVGLALIKSGQFRLWSNTLLLGLNVSLFLYGIFDYYFFMGRYSYKAIWNLDPRQKIEQGAEVALRVSSEIKEVPKNKFKVLLLGGSQTWGAGAFSKNDTMAFYLEEKIKELIPCAVVINGSYGGAIVQTLTGHYLDFYHKLNPDFVVMNIGFNDAFNEEMIVDVKKFISILDPKIHKFVIIEVADYAHASYNSFMRRRFELVEFVEKNSIPYSDVLMDIWNETSRNFLWWDYVHLTSFGQKMVVEKSWPTLSQMLKTQRITCR